MHRGVPAAVTVALAADTSDIDTPDGLYRKLPQDSPIGVRGARNYPCQGQPGKRAPTVEICESSTPFEPLAMRQHATGPYPSTRTWCRRASCRRPGHVERQHLRSLQGARGRPARPAAPPGRGQAPPAGVPQVPAPQSVPDLAPIDQGGTVAPSAYTAGAGGRRWRSPPMTRRRVSTRHRTVTFPSDRSGDSGASGPGKTCCPPHDRHREGGSGMRRLGVSAAAITVAAWPDWPVRRPPPPPPLGPQRTFTATSNGEWATNNDVYHDEQSVRSIWTISTQCSYPTECTWHRHQRQGLDGTDLPDRRRVVRQALHSGLDALLRRQCRRRAGCTSSTA